MLGLMRRTAVLLLAGLVLAGLPLGAAPADRPPREPSLPYATKKRLKELFERYFEAPGEERPAILAEVASLDPIPSSALKDFRKQLFALARKGLRLDGKSPAVFGHPDYPGTYLVSGDSGRKVKGLLVGLHGGGAGSGDGATAAQKWSAAGGQGLICLFPTVIRKENTAWNKEREERYVLELIEAAKRTWPVDTNRVYLAGHSMGGYGTWSIGARHADLFAAITPNAGGIMVQAGADRKIVGLAPGLLPNLHNTPVYFTHSDDDAQVWIGPDRYAAEELAKLRELHPGGYEHVYREYTGLGHGLPPDGTMPIIKWLVAHERDPLPRKLVWQPVLDYKPSFSWLRLDRPHAKTIVAERDGENGFAVTAEELPPGLAICLNEDLVDFRKPVRIAVNGEEVFHDYVPRSAAALLRSVAERNDPAVCFDAEVRLR